MKCVSKSWFPCRYNGSGSLALFLALLFLALAFCSLSVTQKPSVHLNVFLCVVGTLAMLVKVTTAAVPFALVIGLVAVALFRAWRSGTGLGATTFVAAPGFRVDRKSTRLNSSHSRASRMPSSA